MNFSSLLRFGRREVYIYPQNSNKKLVKLAALFIFVVIFVGGFGFFKYERERTRFLYEGKLLRAIAVWREAKSLEGLNDLRARELLREGKALVEDLRKLGVRDARFLTLEKDIADNLARITGEYKISPVLVLDLGLVDRELTIASFASTDKRIFVLDGKLGKIVSFNFEGREVRVLELHDVVKASNITVLGKRIFVRDGQRIAELGEGESKTTALSDGAWGNVLFVRGFGGNLYVGDGGGVWRYIGLPDGRFGPGAAWLSENGKKLYGEVIGGGASFALDGSLWILAKGGDITKLTQGRSDYFVVKDLDVPLKNPIFLETREDLSNLYILDSGNRRVVVLEKSGRYKAQYSWDGIGDAQAVSVSEEKKKMLFFVGNKVYSVELR